MTANPFTVRAQALVASVALPQTFPIGTFVATNPMHGLEHRRFEDAARLAAATTGARSYLTEDDYESLRSSGRITERALRAASEREFRTGTDAPTRGTLTEHFDQAHGTALAARVDDVVAKWCAAYLDEGQAAWPLPHRDLGLFGAWHALAPRDPGLVSLAGRIARRRIKDLPENGAQALSVLVGRRQIQEPDLGDYFRAAYRRLPGWASALARSGNSDDLVAYLAIRLALEDLVLDPAILATDQTPVTRSADGARIERLAVWQEALELGYRDQLLRAISSGPRPATPARPADAQAVFCIDVRSEGLRRHLEACGRYDTIGFAGFFGLPIEVAALEGNAVPSCPVIVEPRATIREVPDVDPSTATGAHDRHDAVDAVWAASRSAKTAPAAPFAFAEAAGWLLGPLAALRTFAPHAAARLTAAARNATEPAIPTRMHIDHSSDPHGGRSGLTSREQVSMAHAALTTMSLTSDFAPLVLLCGHRSSTTNNPFAAALDCGACAGKPGGPNARVLAELLNNPHVREGLADAGHTIPTSTWFVAAEHDTTTDTVRVLDRHLIPPSHAERLARLEADLELAGRRCASERQRTLPGSEKQHGAPGDIDRRSGDWAEPVPEWGLARNAAVVVGPRALTAGRDLERRVFLHSYEPDQDPDGTVLGAILTGPLLVGHWISSQYYFSTVDPDRHGAGTKPLHNVVGGIGVYEGVGGDLRTGLPLESVSFAGRRVHEPMRLLAVVEAPRERLERLVEANSAVAQLLHNGWIRLVAGSNGPDGWAEYRRDGTWERWHDDETDSRAATDTAATLGPAPILTLHHTSVDAADITQHTETMMEDR